MKNDATLMRLRQANPVPPTLFVDGTDLFTQITSQAPNADVRTSSPRRRRLVVALAVVGAAAVLAGAAYAVSNWLVDNLVGPEVTQQEYLAAQHELELPPGYRWPKLSYEPNSVTNEGAGGGHAVLIAQTAWECYWAAAIRRGDVPAQRRAHAELQSLIDNNILVAPIGASENWTPANPPTVPWVAFSHDGGLGWIKQGYVMAAAGDPTRIAQGCRANR